MVKNLHEHIIMRSDFIPCNYTLFNNIWHFFYYVTPFKYYKPKNNSAIQDLSWMLNSGLKGYQFNDIYLHSQLHIVCVFNVEEGISREGLAWGPMITSQCTVLTQKVPGGSLPYSDMERGSTYIPGV